MNTKTSTTIELDPSFGMRGITHFNVSDIRSEVVIAIGADSTGKLYALGNGVVNDSDQPNPFWLARTSHDGLHDHSWGTNGVLNETLLPGKNSSASGMVVLKNNEVVVSGLVTDEVKETTVLVRYLGSGIRNLAFGNSGAVVLDGTQALPEPDHRPDATISATGADLNVIETPSGNLIVPTTNRQHASGRVVASVYSLTPNGTPDTRFGTGGRADIQRPDGNIFVQGIQPQSDGKFLLFGLFRDLMQHFHFMFVRLKEDGTPDFLFGDRGFVLLQTPSELYFGVQFAQSDEGTFYAAGYNYFSNFSQLVSYNNDGTVNTRFNKGKPLDVRLSDRFTMISNIRLDAEGKILMLAELFNPLTGSTSTALARFHLDGALDKSFYDVGCVLIDLSETDVSNVLNSQRDKKLLIAGGAEKGGFISRVEISTQGQ